MRDCDLKFSGRLLQKRAPEKVMLGLSSSMLGLGKWRSLSLESERKAVYKLDVYTGTRMLPA